MANPRPKPQVPARRRRWRRWVLGGVGVVLVTMVLALPKALSSDSGRAWLLGQADTALAPGKLELTSIEFCWFGPVRMTGLVLRDRKGDAVIQAEKAVWDRGLWHALFEVPRLGTLTLDDAVIDSERENDGTIDLYETLRPVLRHDKRTDLRVLMKSGRYRFRSAGLKEPISAERLDFVLEVAPYPKPLNWRSDLSNGPAGNGGESLAVEGSFDQWQAWEGKPADFAIAISSHDWPWSVSLPDGRGAASGRLSGSLSAGCEEGRWRLSGDASLHDLGATLPRENDEPLHLGRVTGKWDLVRDRSGEWSVDRLDINGGDPDRRWSATASARVRESAIEVVGQFGLGLRTGENEREPLGLSVFASLPKSADRIDHVEVAATSRYGRLDVSGQLDARGGRPVSALSGTLAPDWGVINGKLKSAVEPGAEVWGRPAEVRMAMSLTRDWRSSLDGKVAVMIDGADFFGLKLGPTEVALCAHNGKLSLDPIDAVLNVGEVHLAPELVLDDDAGPAIKLGPDSRLKDIVVNDEVSQRILAFAAPVLEKATRVRGKVSAELKEAKIPLGRGKTPDAEVEGAVVFNDVSFRAGSFSAWLLDLLGIEGPRFMRLNQSVALRLADRKVYQRGLAMPLPGNVARLEVEGWVGFDRTLALKVSLPVTPAIVANRPLLREIVEGTSVPVEIGGTLDSPTLDTEALNLALRDLGRTLLNKVIKRGLPGLLMKPRRPREPAPRPAAPPGGC